MFVCEAWFAVEAEQLKYRPESVGCGDAIALDLKSIF